MKRIRILKSFVLMALLGMIVPLAMSCSDDDESTVIGYGTVSGVVTDERGNAISGVEVAITDVEGLASTGSDGRYTFNNVSMEKHAVSFTKKGYQTISATLLANKFSADKVAVIDIAMISASAKVMGTVTDANNGDAPLAGVTVTMGTRSATTGSDGKYLFEDLIAGDFTLNFNKAGYVDITRSIKKADFVVSGDNEIATIDIRMGGTELLRGLTADDLADADKWYYNEYRGGGNADAYPHWDWACDYMCALTFWGNFEEQWEGSTLRIRNDEDQRSNPADMDVFDSFTYGSKKITEDNKILSIRLRTHNADEASPAYFGVQVVDLAAAEPKAVQVGGTRTHGSGDYADYHFDLSDYIGKEVVIAVGIYRAETGDYWKQLVLRRLAFAHEEVKDWSWIHGTEIAGLEGWQLPLELVRSTMPTPIRSFTGISPVGGGRDVSMTSGYPAAYRAWRAVNHIGYEWSFVPLKKDPECFAGEGYVIKTRGTNEVSSTVPEAYFYVKFSIEAGSNIFTLKGRNFNSGSAPDHRTYFKLTAIENDGTVTHIIPNEVEADNHEEAEDGCYVFRHYKGSKDSPDEYARFVYDLSQFNGSDVTLAIGVYNCVPNTSENKLGFYSINLD